MIVNCAKCQAGYEFPVDQLPADGLRAKCASCGHVMWIRSDGTDGAPVDSGSWRRPGRNIGESETPVSTLPPPVVAPPQHQRKGPVPASALELPAGAPRRQRGRDVAALERDPAANRGVRLSELGGARVKDRKSGARTQETAPKEEKSTEQGPSVIIDMGQLSKHDAPEAPVEAAPEAEPAPDAAAFAPLSTAPTPPPKARPSVQSAPPEFGVQETSDIKAVRPPRMWILGVILVLLAAATLLLFVWWRNDWRPIWDDPGTAWEIAIGERPRPVETPPAPAPIVEAATMSGALEVSDVELSLLRLKRGERAAVIRGSVTNGTNRFQRAIGIEASIVDAREEGPLKLKTRTAPCCMDLDEATAKRIAATPDHPHFSDKIDAVAQVRLAPGESRRFAIVLRDLGKLEKGRRLQALATIKFSEPE